MKVKILILSFFLTVVGFTFAQTVFQSGNLFYTATDVGNKKAMLVTENWPALGYAAGNLPTGDVVIPETVVNPDDNETYTVTAVGKESFRYNEQITSVTIPATVEKIDTSAFAQCPNLTSVVFPASSNLHTIHRSAFQYCFGLQEINLPEGLEVIEDWVFLECKNVTKVSLPSTLTTLYEFSFRDMKDPISGVTALTDFYLHASTPPTFMPNGKEDRGAYSSWIFYGTTLGNVTLWVPENSSGNFNMDPWNTFKVRNELVDAEELVVQVDNLFYKILDPTAKTVQVVPENYPTTGYSAGNKPFGQINIPATIVHPANGQSYSVTVIGKHTFYDNEDLTGVSLPATVEKIDSFAFASSKNMTSVSFSNTSNLKQINRSAFEYCWGLTEIELPEGLEVIEDWTFLECKNITKITLPSTITELFDWSLRDLLALTDLYCLAETAPIATSNTFYASQTNTTLWIPKGALSAYSGAPWNAFSEVKEIVDIKDLVVKVGQLYYNVIDDAAKTVRVVPQNWPTLSYDSGKKPTNDVVIPATIVHPYDGNTYTVTVIAAEAFRDNSYVTSISLPNTIEEVGRYAIRFCGNLVSVVFEPGSVNETVIRYGGIFENFKVTNLVLPDKLVKVEMYGVGSLRGLEVLELPASLSTVEKQAFHGDGSGASVMTTVIYHASAPPVKLELGSSDPYTGTNLFGGLTVGNLTLYVPVDAIPAFSSETPWKNFKEIKAIDYGSVDELVVAANEEITIIDDVNYNSVTIAPGGKLTIDAGVSFTAGSLVLQSDDSGTATLVGNYGGEATVKQYVGAHRSWYMSLPVAALNPSELAEVANAYIFTEADEVKDVSSGWSLVSGAVPTGHGVMLNPESGPTTFSFTGLLNNGSIEVKDLTSGKRRFHYLGNPYPSYINWNDLAKENLGEIIWFRTYDNVFKFLTFNGEVGDVEEIEDGSIAPMQGFWVQVERGKTGKLSFTNAMRSHWESGNSLLRAPRAERSLLRLAVSDGVAKDNTVIYFQDSNSNDKDPKDAAKMMSNNSLPEIWTLVNNEAVAINAMQTVPYNTEIPLGFNTSTGGEFTISTTTFSGFSEGDAVDLIDRVTNQVHRLSDQEYTFTADAGKTTNRFGIVFVPAVSTNVEQSDANNLTLFVINDHLHINLGTPVDNARAIIYSVTGEQIGSQTLISQNNTIQHNLRTGVYVVVVENGGMKVAKRIIIK